MSNEWIKFLKINKFGVGISLDGTEEIQNLQRPTAASFSNSFDAVMNGIVRMKSLGLKFGLIQTITQKSLPFLEQSMSMFYNELGLRSWNVNFVDMSSLNHSNQTLALSEAQLFDAYDTVIDFWLRLNDQTLKIDEIDQFVSAVTLKQTSSCHFCGSCGNFVCIDHDGSVFPCDRLCDQAFLMGNVSRTKLLDIILGEKAVAFRKETQVLHTDCLKCKWCPGCNNGCTAMRNDSGKYRHCETRRRVFKKLSRLITKAGKEVN